MNKNNYLYFTVKQFHFLILLVFIASSSELEEVKSRVVPKLTMQLKANGLTLGSQVFARIFKKDKNLELWIKKDTTYHFFKKYPICEYSGELGPKIKNGDHQAPEGIYSITKNLLNPNSKFHLAINIGYPNEYDTYHNRTGSAIMIHGGCVSVGCYAMTDSSIEEIYIIFEETLENHESISVHIFPFKLTNNNITAHNNLTDTSFIGSLLSFFYDCPKYKYNDFIPFWKELKIAYDFFEDKKVLPNITIKNGHYVVTSN